MRIERIQELIVELAGLPSANDRPPPLIDAFRLARESHNWFPDEEEAIEAICRHIDETSDYARAWHMVSDISQTGHHRRPDELSELQIAVGFSVGNSTLAYIDVRTGDVASGVLVNIEDRIFLATTSHSVPASPKGKLSIVCRKSTSINKNLAPIIDSAKWDYKETGWDAAYLELPADFAIGETGKFPISLDRIMPCGAGYEDRLTCVAGYPSSIIKDIERTDESLTKLFTPNCWFNKLFPQKHWHILGEDGRSADETMDVFIPYPRDDDFHAFGPLQDFGGPELAEPFGMSGGGYWQPKVELKRHLFLPDYYALIAIQSHWWRRGRYLQATQIVHWLRLVYRHKPELQSTLAAAFPGIDLG